MYYQGIIINFLNYSLSSLLSYKFDHPITEDIAQLPNKSMSANYLIETAPEITSSHCNSCVFSPLILLKLVSTGGLMSSD